MFKPMSILNPFTTSLSKFFSNSGILSASRPCPLFGPQAYVNISLSTGILMFFPKGVLLLKGRYFNEDYENIMTNSIVILNV